MSSMVAGNLSRAAFQHALQAPVGAFGELAVDEHGEAFLEAERRVVGVLALFEQAADHARQAQGAEPVNGGVVQHGGSFFHW